MSEESSRFSHVFGDIVRRSAGEVLSEYGGSLPWNPLFPMPPITDEHVGGFVTFLGRGVRGSLAIISTFPIIAALHPARARGQAISSAGDRLLLRDFAGELANQLLGRVKNRLWAFGLRFETSVPNVYSGRPLSLAIQALKPVRSFLFSRDQDVAVVLVEAPDASHLHIEPRADLPAALKEGDALLF
jgi:hypothetical protein